MRSLNAAAVLQKGHDGGVDCRNGGACGRSFRRGGGPLRQLGHNHAHARPGLSARHHKACHSLPQEPFGQHLRRLGGASGRRHRRTRAQTVHSLCVRLYRGRGMGKRALRRNSCRGVRCDRVCGFPLSPHHIPRRKHRGKQQLVHSVRNAVAGGAVALPAGKRGGRHGNHTPALCRRLCICGNRGIYSGGQRSRKFHQRLRRRRAGCRKHRGGGRLLFGQVCILH